MADNIEWVPVEQPPEDTEWVPEGVAETPKPSGYLSALRTFAGDAGSAVKRGYWTGQKMIGGAQKALSPVDSAMYKQGQEVQEVADLKLEQAGPAQERPDRGVVADTLLSGVEAVTQMAPVIATSAIPGVGVVLGPAVAATMYGGSTYQDTKERVLKQEGLTDAFAAANPDDPRVKKANRTGVATGTVQGALDAAMTIVGGKLIRGFAPSFGKATAGKVLEGVANPKAAAIKRFGKAYLTGIVAEAGTEVIQDETTAAIERQAGLLDAPAFGEQAAGSAQGGAGAAILLGPLAGVGHYQRFKSERAVKEALTNPAVDPDVRTDAAKIVADQLARVNKGAAVNFLNHAADAIGSEAETGTAPYKIDLNDKKLLLAPEPKVDFKAAVEETLKAKAEGDELDAGEILSAKVAEQVAPVVPEAPITDQFGDAILADVLSQGRSLFQEEGNPWDISGRPQPAAPALDTPEVIIERYLGETIPAQEKPLVTGPTENGQPVVPQILNPEALPAAEAAPAEQPLETPLRPTLAVANDNIDVENAKATVSWGQFRTKQELYRRAIQQTGSPEGAKAWMAKYYTPEVADALATGQDVVVPQEAVAPAAPATEAVPVVPAGVTRSHYLKASQEAQASILTEGLPAAEQRLRDMQTRVQEVDGDSVVTKQEQSVLKAWEDAVGKYQSPEVAEAKQQVVSILADPKKIEALAQQRGTDVQGVTDQLTVQLDQYNQILSGTATRADFEPAKEVITKSQYSANAVSTADAERTPFFSKVQQLVEKKVTGSADAEQIRKMLANNGASPAEIEQTLGGLKGKVSRQEVLDEIRANGVELQDVVLGEGPVKAVLMAVPIQDAPISFGKAYPEAKWVVYRNNEPIFTSEAETAEGAKSEYSPENDDEYDESQGTQFSSYQEPGAKEGSYREMFVTAPGTESSNVKPDSWNVVRSSDGRLIESFKDESRANAVASGQEGLEVIPIRNGSDARAVAKAGWQDGHSQYSDIQNPVVRIRFNTREADGKNLMFIEEMQGPSDAEQAKMPEYLRKRIYDLGVKRVLAYAKENGFDGVAWTPGEMQAKRYDLSKEISRLNWSKNTDGSINLEALKDGNTVIEETAKDVQDVERFVGKEIAKQIGDAISGVSREPHVALTEKEQARYGFIKSMVAEGRTLSPVERDQLNRYESRLNGGDAKVAPKSSGSIQGDNLKVGGEGLKRLYDQTLPALFKKYGKEGVGETSIGVAKDSEQQIVHRDGGVYVADQQGNILAGPFASTREAASTEVLQDVKVPYLPITQNTPESYSKFSLGSTAERTLDPATVDKLTLAMARILPGGKATIYVTDRIRYADSEAFKAHGLTEGEVVGLHQSTLNITTGELKSVISLAYNGATEATGYHELLHAAESLGILSPKDMTILEAAYPDADGKASSELRADAFGQYSVDRNAVKPLVRRVFDKIRDFIAKVKNALTGLGYRSANDVFADLYSGKMKENAGEGRYQEAQASTKTKNATARQVIDLMDYEAKEGFERKQDLAKYAKEVASIFNGLPDQITVYRAVAADSIEAVDVGEDIGEHWAMSKDAALTFAQHNLFGGKVFIVKGTVAKSDVDMDASIKAWTEFSALGMAESEEELLIPYTPDKVLVKDIQVADRKTAKGNPQFSVLPPKETLNAMGARSMPFIRATAALTQKGIQILAPLDRAINLYSSQPWAAPLHPFLARYKNIKLMSDYIQNTLLTKAHTLYDGTLQAAGFTGMFKPNAPDAQKNIETFHKVVNHGTLAQIFPDRPLNEQPWETKLFGDLDGEAIHAVKRTDPETKAVTYEARYFDDREALATGATLEEALANGEVAEVFTKKKAGKRTTVELVDGTRVEALKTAEGFRVLKKQTPPTTTGKVADVPVKAVRLKDGTWEIRRVVSKEALGVGATKEEALKNAGSEEITARHEWDVKNMPERTGYKTLTEAHDVLSRAYKSMPEALQQHYQEKQKQIKEFTAVYTKALRDRIINSTESGEARDALLARLDRQFKMKGPYSPLMRYGDYVLNVYDKQGGTRIARYQYDTTIDRAKAERELLAETPGLWTEKSTRAQWTRAESNIPASFIDKMTEIIRASGANQEAAEGILADMEQLWFAHAPETSAMKHSMRRTGLAGFDEDSLRAHLSYVNKIARATSTLVYGGQQKDVLDGMQEVVNGITKEGGDPTKLEGLMQYLKNQDNAVRDERISPVVRKLSAIPFVWYLTSPSTFIVQSTQPFAFSYPYLAARGYGAMKSFTAIVQGYKNQVDGKFTTETLNNYVFADKESLTDKAERLIELTQSNDAAGVKSLTAGMNEEELKLLAMKKGELDGTFNISQTHEALDVIVNGQRSKWNKVLDRASTFMRVSELASRKSVFAAAFDLEFEKTKNFEGSMNFAREAVAETLFNYNQSNRPIALTGWAGRLFGQFRTYQLNGMFKLIQLTHDSFVGMTPETKKTARKELAFMVGSVGAMAGSLGIPFAPAAFAALNFLFGDEDDPFDVEEVYAQAMREMLGDTAGNVVLKGLPALLGADMSRRTGMQGMFNVFTSEQPERLHGADLFNWYVGQATGPAGGVAAGMFKAKQAYEKGNWYGALRASLPKAMGDLVKAAQIADEGQVSGARTIQGPENFSMYDWALAAAGLNPMQMSLASEEHGVTVQASARIAARKQELSGDLARAIADSDADGRDAAIEDIIRFNKKAPAFAFKSSDLAQAVKREMMARRGIAPKREQKIKMMMEGR